MEEYLDLSDLSDMEDAEQLDMSPFSVDWLDFKVEGSEKKLGICSLPGCKYKKSWRSLSYDIKCLKDMGVQDVFCFCTFGELHLYRAQVLLKKYEEAGLKVHHHPFDDGNTPTVEALMTMLQEIKHCFESDRKTIIHCHGGLGRSCLVATCFSIALDKDTKIEETRDKMKQLRGVGALGSVKQYNFVNDFRNTLDAYKKNSSTGGEDRCASR